MSRNPESREYWLEETAFIENQWALDTKDRMDAFPAYVKMQASFARKDGFPDLALRIEKRPKSD